MKNKKVKTAFFSAICVFAFALLFAMINNDKNSIGNKDPGAEAKDYYTVAEYDGKIAVFKNEENIPLEIFDSYAAVLPEADRELLRNGIRVNSTEELQKIIEDYTS